MTKPTSQDAGGDCSGLAAVGLQVKAQVRELRDVAALLRDVALAHDKYAQEHRKVALAAPPNVVAAPPLLRVVQRLEQVLGEVAQAHTTLALELASAVAAPLEAFEKQQRHQTKQLVLEIDGAFQRERQSNHTLAALIDTCTRQGVTAAPPCDDDNQSLEMKTEGDEKSSLIERIRDPKDKRDSERSTIKQRLEELDLTNEQQAAIVEAQLRRCFEVFTRHINRVQREVTQALLPPLTLTETGTRAGGDVLNEAVTLYDLHIEATQWMISVFSQMIPMEEAMLKRFQTMSKTHSPATISRVFAPSTLMSGSAPELTTLWDLAQSHKQRMVNLSDPIGRTLRFSKQKHETIRKELVDSLDETQKLVQAARSKVKDKENKLAQLIQQEQRQEQPQQVLGATGIEAVMASGLSTFGLRSAVVSWTKQLNSPKKPLLKSKSSSSVGFIVSERSPPKQSESSAPVPTSSLSPRHILLRKDLSDTRMKLEKLEAKETAQRSEIVQTLGSTALISVKTMELMVNEYLKNVSKAMTIASTATLKCAERLMDGTSTEGGAFGTFSRISLFVADDIADNAIAKLIASDDKSPSPETNAIETESENLGEIEDRNNGGSVVADKSGALAVVVKPGTRPIVGEVEKLWTQLLLHDNATSTIRRVLEIGTQSVDFARRVAAAPEKWTCVAMVIIILGLLSFVRRLGQLDEGWHELAKMQEENAINLQQIAELIRG